MRKEAAIEDSEQRAREVILLTLTEQLSNNNISGYEMLFMKEAHGSSYHFVCLIVERYFIAVVVIIVEWLQLVIWYAEGI